MGISLLGDTQLWYPVFATVLLLAYRVARGKEAVMMEKMFGREYREYASRTARLVPHVL